MTSHRLVLALSLVRQGFSVTHEFGVHSIEALLWVAETVKDSVYDPRSLVRSPEGLSFGLSNPPLRMGAFSSLKVWVDRVEVPPASCKVRVGTEPTWRTTAEISRASPLELRPGTSLEVALSVPTVPTDRPVTVRMELHNIAISPLVWFEFVDTPRAAGGV